jgi:hypothetical protein
VFRLVLKFSGLSLYSPPPAGEVNDTQVSSRRDCFVMSLLDDDAFYVGVMRWMVYPTPAPPYGSQSSAEEAVPTCRTSSGLCRGDGQ